jgi:hypothetical protein
MMASPQSDADLPSALPINVHGRREAGHVNSCKCGQRMSRKSGYRFSEKDMRKRKNLERIPIQLKRDAL